MEQRNLAKKIVMMLAISMLIMFNFLTVKSEATNKTNEVNTSKKQNVAQNTTNTTNETTTKATKSSNANLADLGITPHDFKGFKYGTTYYEVAVPEETESVEVYAKAQHEGAKLTGTGKKKLEKGENKVEVVVTAEDGTKKTYTINIIREIVQENQEDENENIAEKEGNIAEKATGLSSLVIEGVSITPEFKTNIYEYKAKYIGEATKLSINTKPTNEAYVVEITGNEELKEGENIITILVSEKDGDNVATYQIAVEKSLVDEEAIAREQAEKQEKQKKIIIGIIIAVVVIGIIIFFIIRSRRNRRYAEEFSGIPFYKNKEDEDEYEEDEYEEYDEQYEQEEEEIENIPKETLKERFLKNYGNHEEEYEEEYKEPKRKKHKGKRFK